MIEIGKTPNGNKIIFMPKHKTFIGRFFGKILFGRLVKKGYIVLYPDLDK